MLHTSTLDIRGYRDEPVRNTFFRQEEDTRHLAILLPGLGYTAAMPALWYPRQLLLGNGADVMAVEYSYGGRPEFKEWGAEQEEWFYADVAAAGRVVLEQRDYEEVTILGKSLGTLAMGHLLGDNLMDATRAIWLTPLLRQEGLREQIRRWGGRSLFAIGTADPHYVPALLDEVCEATHGEAVVIQDADHILEVPGDVTRSIAEMERLARAIEQFI